MTQPEWCKCTFGANGAQCAACAHVTEALAPLHHMIGVLAGFIAGRLNDAEWVEFVTSVRGIVDAERLAILEMFGEMRKSGRKPWGSA